MAASSADLECCRVSLGSGMRLGRSRDPLTVWKEFLLFSGNSERRLGDHQVDKEGMAD